MTKFFQTILLVGALALAGCTHPGTENGTTPGQQTDSVMSDSAFLDLIQKASMNYMWDGADATSGLAYERIHLDGEYGGNDPEIVTTGGSGFGIAGLVVAMDRGFITRKAGVERLQKIVSYLKRADRFQDRKSVV